LENLKVRSRTDEELGDLIHYLSQFDFKIVYNPGVTNEEADCLSRNPVLEPEEGVLDDCIRTVNVLTLEQIKLDQANIIMDKNDEKKNDIIYKKIKGIFKIRLTEKRGRELIKKVHVEYGHIGTKHMSNILRPYYYIQNMSKKLFDICSTCEICIKNKTRTIREKGFLGHLGPATKPFEIVSLDTIGGFGGRRSSKRYIHLLVDHFTRHAFILTSKNQTSDEFIKLINKVHNEHPIGTLLTDQYGALSSHEFMDYLDKLNINHIFTAVDCPSSNGLNERLNQTLVNRIRCRINEIKSKIAWTTIAYRCVNEYNDTPHSVTKFAPSYLLYQKESNIVPPELREKRNLDDDRKIAFENSLINHNNNKVRLDKNKKAHDFKLGDLVYIVNGNKLNRGKLDEISTYWTLPYF
jgi:transposase InsO family protein